MSWPCCRPRTPTPKRKEASMAAKKTNKTDAPPAVLVQCSTLRKALTEVKRAAPGRTVLPILYNVLLDAAGGLLRLTMTDLEVGISQFVGAEVNAPLTTTVPH